jgi:hypothetical protein
VAEPSKLQLVSDFHQKSIQKHQEVRAEALALLEDLKLAGGGGGDLSGPPMAGVPNAPHLPGAPGETIAHEAQQASEASGGSGNWAHGFGHNAHVKTPGGEKLFHEPIGALIIAHGSHPHEAAAAVHAGTHKYVQAGEKTFAVQKDADVHVPKDVDIHDEGAVQKAAKIVVGKHPETGEAQHAVVTPHTKAPLAAKVTPQSAQSLGEGWKPLPHAAPKKPVALNDKHAGWVPHDWKVYQVKGSSGSAMKWAKDPDGKWHVIKGDVIAPMPDYAAAKVEEHVKAGGLVQEGGYAAAEAPKAAKAAEHVPAEVPADLHAVPHTPTEGAEKPKINIGGVHVTHDEIQSAIAKLEAAKSTNVKAPLKGHPLADMDYMGVADKEIAAHPELKVPSGSKKFHVGKVKNAVLHHLYAQAGKLSHSQAEVKHAQEGLDATESAAEHAAKLTPSVAEFPALATEPAAQEAEKGEEAAKEAAEVPQEAPSLPEPEKPKPEVPDGEAKAGPLYYDKQEGPGSWPKYEQVGGGNWNKVQEDGTKEPAQKVPTFLSPVSKPEAPQEAAEEAAPEEAPSQPEPEQPAPEAPKAAPVGKVKAPGEGASWGGVQVTTEQLQEAADWLDATQTGHGSFKAAMKAKGNPMADADYMGVAKAWKAANSPAVKGLNTKQLMLAHVNDLLSTMKQADEETGFNEASELHQAIKDAVVSDDLLTADEATVKALQMSATTGKPAYLFKNADGDWQVTFVKDVAASTGLLVAHPDHSVFSFTSGKEGSEWNISDILDIVKNVQSLAAEEEQPVSVVSPEPEVSQGNVTYPDYPQHEEIEQALDNVDHVKLNVAMQSNALDDQLARALWSSHVVKKSPRYVISGEFMTTVLPVPGTFGSPGKAFYKVLPNHVIVYVGPEGNEIVMSGLFALDLVNDKLVSEAPVEAEQAAEEAGGPAEEAKAATIGVWVNGKKVADVPEGSKIYTGAKAANPATSYKYVKFPDGSWHEYTSIGMKDDAVSHVVLNEWTAEAKEDDVASGGLKLVTGPAAEGKTLFQIGKNEYWAEPGTTAWKDQAYPDLGLMLRGPDGKWQWMPADDTKLMDSGSQPGELEAGIQSGDLVPHGHDAEQYAKALGAAKKNVPPLPSALEPEKPPAVTEWKDVKVGSHTYTIPADAKVYWWTFGAPSEEEADVKYAQFTNGEWKAFYSDGGTNSGVSMGHYVGTNSLLPTGEKKEAQAEVAKAGEEAAEVPGPTTEESPKTEAKPVPALSYMYYGGYYSSAGEFPAGSQLYKDTQKGHYYAKAPDGKWWSVGSSKPHEHTAPVLLENKVTSGLLKPVEKSEFEKLASEVKAQEELRDAVQKGAVKEGPWKTWQETMVASLVQGTGGAKYIHQLPVGTWTYSNWAPYTKEYWEVQQHTFAAVHHFTGADGKSATEDIPFADVKQIINDHLIANAVPLDGKPVKFGFYYKPKGTAYLEVKHGDGLSGKNNAADKAVYLWHDAKGDTKAVTPKFAAKFIHMDGGNEYHELPKGAAEPDKLTMVSYASVLKPGFYGAADLKGEIKEGDGWEFHPDGSVTMYYSGGAKTHAFSASAADTVIPAMLGEAEASGGEKVAFLVDKYGTSVVKPGIQPDYYFIWGSKFSKEDVQKMLDDVVKAPPTVPDAWGKAFEGHFPAASKKLYSKYGAAFMGDHYLSSGTAQRDAVTALLRELLLVPQQPSDANLAGVEVTYLKGLPPGINTAKDVFAWTGHGYAKPFSGVLDKSALASMSSTDLADKIKAVSAEFGGGKVVGTHVSSLTKGQREKWLEAWSKGDMKTVFALDAQGGKVSPAHPGAPANTGTLHVTWSPWDESQQPAGHVPQGTWTPPGTTPSGAEVNNYLILAGLKHPEYLTMNQRRQWMQSHRDGDQAAVDKLSKAAHDAFGDSSKQPVTGPIFWTDDVKPAKSYDVLVEDGKSANSWPDQALKDYYSDHDTELQPFYQQVADENGMSLQDVKDSVYSSKDALQKYLDHQVAVALAEEKRPKYALVPGETGMVADQYGRRYLWTPATQQEIDRHLAIAGLLRSWGSRAPSAQAAFLEADHTPGVITQEVQPDGTLAHVQGGMGSLSARELSDIAREHVLDQALANPHSTPGSYLRLADGSVIAADRGGAFSAPDWNGTDLAGMNAYAQHPVSKVLAAVASQSVLKEDADKAYAAAVRAARNVSKTPETAFRGAMEQAGVSPASQDAIVARLATLPDDVQGMWDKAYAQAGWTPPVVPQKALSHGLHSGFSELGFIEHAVSSKSNGVPAFFAGPHLEDGHVLVWTEKAGQNSYLRGEASARGQALTSLIAWAQAHEGDAGKVTQLAGQVPGTDGWYKTIINAAKAVSMHAADQKWDGAWTSAQISNLYTLRDTLESALDDVKGGSYSGAHGPGWLAESALTHYLSQVQKIVQAKATHGTFKEGDIPDWVPPPGEKQVQAGVKVVLKDATRVLSKAHTSSNDYSGDLLNGNGELELGDAVYEYPGKAWHVTLPTGEQIEVNDSGITSTPDGQEGRIRFTVPAGTGSAGLERVRSQLQEMGLPMEEAQQHDLELFYWRHLAGILNERNDSVKGKNKDVWEALKAAHGAGSITSRAARAQLLEDYIAAGHDPQEELATWRDAWANLTSPGQVKEWVNSGGYLPHLSAMDLHAPDVRSGKPFWYRFDANAKLLAGKEHVPLHGIHSESQLPSVVKTGALYSTEARIRALGLWTSGQSSKDDMVKKGSSGFAYTRLNKSPNNGHVFFSPRIMARTSNYSWNTDNWGNIAKRAAEAAFSLETATGHAADNNEMMVKDAISFLDDVLAIKIPGSADRAAVISFLKDAGVNEIRGVPVEERILSSVSQSDIDGLMKKEDVTSWFAHQETSEDWAPSEPLPAPSAAKPGAVKPVAAGPAGVFKGSQFSVQHSIAPAEKEVSNFFYGQPTKPNVTNSLASSVKHQLAKDLTAKMKSSEEDLKALAQAAGLSAPSNWGDTESERIVAALIATWAQGNSSPIALALQNQAHSLFGIEKVPLPPVGFATGDDESAAKELEGGHSAVLRDFLQAQWQGSQDKLSAAGIEHVTLYRIMKFDTLPSWASGKSAGDVIDAPAARPLAPWAFTKSASESAGIFGSGGHAVTVKATVPKAAILSVPKTGFGCYNEGEFVVLDMGGQWELVTLS